VVAAFKETCGKCGAVRHDAGIGLEKTPEEYVANIVQVFREVRRVLRDDGTLWLNLGDCYARDPRRGVKFQAGASTYLTNQQADEGNRGPAIPDGLKEKDLVGIPWRVAFALQADGWYLRSDIIWHKPNPMPESVRDRPTKAHEYLFLLTKQPRYYYDAEAIVEETTSDAGNRREFRGAGSYTGGNSFVNDAVRPNGVRGNDGIPRPTRNRRDVWTIPTHPYKGAHFATYPEKLVEPCILAGSKPGDVVLDPFCGSGTTGAVAIRHGRDFVGIDMSPEYLELARCRIEEAQVLLPLSPSDTSEPDSAASPRSVELCLGVRKLTEGDL
jgi:DNA modification methylase